MIKIEEVPLPKDQPSTKMDKSMRKAVDRFKEAYKKVYGVTPTVTYVKPWLKVRGFNNRVTRQRLIEMAKQLEYRHGED